MAIGNSTPATQSGIYQIRHIASGKRYVGSAVDIEARWRTHRWALTRSRHHSVMLQRAWLKHGSAAFAFEILEMVPDTADLIAREQAWLDRLQPFAFDKSRGYNTCSTAGSRLGVSHDAEARRKISAAHKGRKHSPEHVAKLAAILKGRKPSPETLAAAARRKKQLSPEARARMSAIRKGRKHSPEAIARISASKMGKPLSPEHRASIAATKKGKNHGPLNPETRAKIAAAKRGRKHSPEARARMVIAWKKRRRGPSHDQQTFAFTD